MESFILSSKMSKKEAKVHFMMTKIEKDIGDAKIQAVYAFKNI
jgi:hypothetical protein